MSTKDTSDGEEPVGDGGFEEELSRFLADEGLPDSDGDDDGEFNLPDFMEALRNVEGVCFNTSAGEVPLDAFVEAQRAGALFNLEIAVDDYGRPYLLGMVFSDGDRAVIASVSFAEVENRDGADPYEDDETGEWEE